MFLVRGRIEMSRPRYGDPNRLRAKEGSTSQGTSSKHPKSVFSRCLRCQRLPRARHGRIDHERTKMAGKRATQVASRSLTHRNVRDLYRCRLSASRARNGTLAARGMPVTRSSLPPGCNTGTRSQPPRPGLPVDNPPLDVRALPSTHALSPPAFGNASTRLHTLENPTQDGTRRRRRNGLRRVVYTNEASELAGAWPKEPRSPLQRQP